MLVAPSGDTRIRRSSAGSPGLLDEAGPRRRIRVPQRRDGLKPTTAEASTADHCVAFLAGNLAEYGITHSQIVSTWEWTNLLAHGAEGDLRREATGDDPRQSLVRGSAPEDGWLAARSYLASELLDLVGGRGSFCAVQRSALVPLELELACNPQAARWRPHEWVFAVEQVLTAWRTGSRFPISRGSHLPP